MACEQFIVEDVSAEMIERIIQALLNAGAIVEGNNPWHIVIKDKGIELTAEWSESKKELKIKVTKKPFLAPCALINNKLKEEIEKARLNGPGNDMFMNFNLDIDI